MNTPLSEIDEKIIKILRESPEPLSTYEIAKKINISWSTANVHLKDLQLKELVKSREDMVKSKRRIVWWVEQRTIDKFL
jgi:predicted transcriptional regulator